MKLINHYHKLTEINMDEINNKDEEELNKKDKLNYQIKEHYVIYNDTQTTMNDVNHNKTTNRIQILLNKIDINLFIACITIMLLIIIILFFILIH
jgi:hypothetical protein